MLGCGLPEDFRGCTIGKGDSRPVSDPETIVVE